MTAMITLSLDAMGGDIGPSVTVPAACNFLRHNQDCQIILTGDEAKIRDYLSAGSIPGLQIRATDQVVEMDELPSHALRHKKNSSMRVAIDLVKSGEAQACVSSGNTGALMATSRFVLKMIQHIDRPAIISAIPALDGRTWMLDLGANIECNAEHLRQFAIMGTELIQAVDGIDRPSAGLLNVGQEEIKGIAEVKLAHQLIGESDLHYIGYVEGDGIYLQEGLDLVVSDGFAGNVALKASEGLAKFIKKNLYAEYQRTWFSRIAAVCSLPVLKRLQRRIDPRCYNGASLLGLRGIVIKSHGGADQMSIENALMMAKKEVHADVANRIADKVTAQLS